MSRPPQTCRRVVTKRPSPSRKELGVGSAGRGEDRVDIPGYGMVNVGAVGEEISRRLTSSGLTPEKEAETATLILGLRDVGGAHGNELTHLCLEFFSRPKVGHYDRALTLFNDVYNLEEADEASRPQVDFHRRAFWRSYKVDIERYSRNPGIRLKMLENVAYIMADLTEKFERQLEFYEKEKETLDECRSILRSGL